MVRVNGDLHQAWPAARDDRAVREGNGQERRRHRALNALRVRCDHGGCTVLQWCAQPLRRVKS